MVSYKCWLDTRWQFAIGAVVLLVAACSIPIAYPQVLAVLATLDPDAAEGPLAESVRIQATYSGFVWSAWFSQNLTTLLTVLAALLGSGSPLASSGRGVLFSLALPTTRRRWIGSRAAVGIAELLALALLASLAIPALSPLIGEHYELTDALVQGVCVFAGACVFFGVAVLLSTVFNDVWRPFLLTCLAALVLSILEFALPDFYGLFAVMSADSYFDHGALPWAGLAASAALTALLLYAAAAHIVRRDF